MKKIKEFARKNYKLVIGFIVGIVLSGTTCYAVTVLSSTEVSYNNTDSDLSATTVQGAIDEVYTKTQNALYKRKCKDCPKCIRASTLHTELCTQTSDNYFCSGAGYTTSGSKKTNVITYGSIGTSGVLTSGDAFDCDVNGDSIYDSNTERFYYVTDMDENTAVMIYYNNVSSGSPMASSTFAYDASESANNIKGPLTAIKQLPTTSQWSNISLTNTIRKITNEVGGNTTTIGTLPTEFSYEGYAARLLTVSEVESVCTIGLSNFVVGELDECNYLLENTKFSSKTITSYAYWLENPASTAGRSAWFVAGNLRAVSAADTLDSSAYSVRPAIEVQKSDISY